MTKTETNLKQPKQRDNDGLHKRRGIRHFKLKVGGRWKECSTHTTSCQAAREERQRVVHYSHIRMQAKREAVSMLEKETVSAETGAVGAAVN